MAISKKPVRGTSPADIKNINDNTDALWYKLFGNLSLGDINSEFLDKVMTQYVTVQEEGNLDATHPLYIRFFIPPNTKKIVSAPINIMLSRYRMDSSVTAGGGGVSNVDVAVSTVAQSVSASVVGSTATATASTKESETRTSSIKFWSGNNVRTTPPSSYFDAGGTYTSNGYMMARNDARAVKTALHDDGSRYIDLHDMYHEHDVIIPSHSHTISIAPHTHSISIEPHTHDISAKVTIPPHNHDLTEGIKDSTVAPNGVRIYVNNTAVGNALSGDGTVVNDLNIADNLLIGAWNTIRVTSQNVSRITIYGIIELINKFNISQR